MSFDGKVAIVTGGAEGIGRAFVSTLLNIGMKVCICDIKEDKVKEFMEALPLAHRNSVIFQKCDVASYTDFKDAFDKVISLFERIDVVINNAGIVNEQNWRKAIETNFVGVVHGTKLGLEYMDINKGGHGGRIINMGSVASFAPSPLRPVYCATKHAIAGITKSYGTDYHLKKTGVTVNAICPARVDTDILQLFFDNTLGGEELKKERIKNKLIKPEIVAKALLRLLADSKNGAFLRVDPDGMDYYA